MIAPAEQHEDEIGCVLWCVDRVMITGTLPDIRHPKAIACDLSNRDIHLCDYARWAEPLRDEARLNAKRLAALAGLAIEFICKFKAFRKEDRVEAILAKHGRQPRLVDIFAATKTRSFYRAWHYKASGKNFFKPITGRCADYSQPWSSTDLGAVGRQP